MSKIALASALLALTSVTLLYPASGCTSPHGEGPLGSASSALTDGGGGVATRGGVVISQVYGGGGEPNATYDSDFVELLNRTKAPISLAGLSLQVAGPDSDFGSGGAILPLSGTVGPGEYVLIALAGAGSGDGDPLPAPDLIGALALGDTAGKVALATSTAALGCGGIGGTRCAATKVLDIVGYGLVSDFEGLQATTPLTAQKSALRKAKGCTDTNDNRADFTTADLPAPRNAAAAKADCPVTPPPGPTSTATSTATGGRDAGPPPPFVRDPPLGPEQGDNDAGSKRDAGTAAAGGAEEGCAVAAVGHGARGSAFGLVLAAAFLFMRRRARRGGA